MQEQGAEGIVFSCTEIPLLIEPGECTIPAFDTTLIHANAAVKYSLDMQDNFFVAGICGY